MGTARFTLAEPGGDRRQSLGHRGEALAAQELERRGMTILERRFRVRFGEIDLIALDADLLVFVEVKTRRSEFSGTPAAAVTRSKQRRLGRIALAYLVRRGWLERPTRFDVVEVIAPQFGRVLIRHISDAFRLEE